MEGFNSGETVYIHSYITGSGNNKKLKQVIRKDWKEAVEYWKLLGGCLNTATIVAKVI